MNKAYPKYKPSGVEWLGDVPEHWGVKRLKHIATRITKGTTPSTLGKEFTEEGILFLKVESISDKMSILDEMCVHIDSETDQLLSRSRLRENDVVLSIAGAIGRTAIIRKENLPANTNQALSIISPQKNKTSPKWICYSANGKYFTTSLSVDTVKTAQENVSLDTISNSVILLPPLPEQQAIATFLDRETGRIDGLIAKKLRLLELLAEQRTALISRAVTKGLDASVKLKPSGVEWLGDVPEHWEALPLKRIVAIPVTDGPHETPEILDEGIPFVSAEAIRANKIDFSRKRGFISEAEHRRFCLKYHPKRDDIYMIKSGATTGNLAIVETDKEFSIWSPLAVVRVHSKKADARFVLAAMNSKEFQTSVQLFWSFGTQQNIGMNVIENLPIPLPPLTEQQAIAAFLDRETAKIDTLSAKVTTVIERLKEYRTALISSAVTGKIDVREAV